MITDAIIAVKKRIASACEEPRSITVVAISKGRSIAEIQEAIEAGITDIGENRVQEALLKYEGLQAAGYGNRFKFHMVGHLQTNKAKDAVRIFDLIQSVDSIRLAEEINTQAARINKIQDILIEVNTSAEAAKYGLKPKEAMGAIKEISRFENITIKGLMTIAPVVDVPEKARPYFRILKELAAQINALRNSRDALRILSMGMTDDFEAAVQEGSNMVRLGRALFD